MTLHGQILGGLLIGSWAVVSVWALVLRFGEERETPAFWRVVSIAQILLGAQAVVGLVMLILGRRPGPADDGRTMVFHLAYGLVFPLIVLIVGHKYARDGRYRAHSVFAFAAFVIFGLTARAYMVGQSGA